MNYYKKHLGDYARDTGHLSALEHGIYNLLLDWYYVNEKPIPQDRAVKIARGNPEETQSVLSEYFKLTPEGWIHGYADKEIAKYRAKADRNRDVGKLGGRPIKSMPCSSDNPEETQMVSENNPDITLATNPLIHKSKKEQDQKKTREQVALPDWLPKEVWADWCEYRRRSKAPWTTKAKELSIKRLSEYRKRGHSPKEVIELAIEKGWQGLYEPNFGAQNANHTTPNRKLSVFEQVQQTIERQQANRIGEDDETVVSTQ